jgi:dihydroorotate dehydrogenase electron transfer subunit
VETERRNTIYHLQCPVEEVVALEGEHYRLRFKAPEIARESKPGQFVNVRIPSRIEEPLAFDSYRSAIEYHEKHPQAQRPFLLARPLGVHRTYANGSVEVLFKALGRGTGMLAASEIGQKLDVLGPIGNAFDLSQPPETAILVAGGTGIAPLYLLTKRLYELGSALVVLVGTGYNIPMAVSDSEEFVHFLDEDVTAVIEEYAELGAVVRLATLRPRPGCFTGTSVDLLSHYVGSLTPEELLRSAVFSCGPWAMQAAVAELAEKYKLPCQVLLEERMGCGLGACMACVCKIRGDDGQYAYRRVCVDGPVFWAENVGWKERE